MRFVCCARSLTAGHASLGLLVPGTSTCSTLHEFGCGNKLPQVTLDSVAVRSGHCDGLSNSDATVRFDNAKQLLGERSQRRHQAFHLDLSRESVLLFHQTADEERDPLV